jgi:transcriptional regulator GlxA family with amidase domain
LPAGAGRASLDRASSVTRLSDRRAPLPNPRRRHCAGSTIYSAGSGAVLLAATGRLDGRSLKRRFKAAIGSTLIGHVQNLRIEEAKRTPESDDGSWEEIAAAVGYENPAFLHRLFERGMGLTPGEYRRMFRPLATAADLAGSVETAAA